MHARLSSFVLVALAGCGGGGAGTGAVDMNPSPPTAVLDPVATGTVALSAVSFDSAARTTGAQDGTLDQDSNAFVLDGRAGVVDAGQGRIALTGGGQIALTGTVTPLAVIFDANPATGNRTQGVLGIATPIAAMPASGSVAYAGTAVVTIRDDVTIYDLSGQAAVTADLDAGTVQTAISALSGSARVGLAAPTTVTDVAGITFNGSPITGTRFAGGALTVTSSAIAPLSGSATSNLSGTFIGARAEAAGITFVIDDSTAGSVSAFGLMVAR